MTTDTALTGLFGKLPAHGDFVYRNLSSQFIQVWDEWLQHFMSASREQIGEVWLDKYLTSPLWRFVFSAGVIDQHAWAGVLIPSVDRVGRYFPVSAVKKIPDQINPLEFFSSENEWYTSVEDALLEALQSEIDVDELMLQINALSLKQAYEYRYNTSLDEKPVAIFNKISEQNAAEKAYANLLDAVLSHAISSYSFWSTQGSEYVAPCAFSCQGLPAVKGIAAMLDGKWEQWNWQQPYTYNAL